VVDDDEQTHAGEPIVIGDLEVDVAASRARLRGRTLPLRSREFELLAYLAARRGEFVPRADILRDVWNDDDETKHNTLHVHLATLRTKLGERARRPRLVTTRRRGGIKLDVPTPTDQPVPSAEAGLARQFTASATTGNPTRTDAPPSIERPRSIRPP
jgi:DNA-binding response OmpR family regulator